MNAISPHRMSVFNRLLDALRDGGRTHEIHDVMAALREGRAQVWTGDNDSVVVTEILLYPQKRVMRYWLAAGSLADILPLVPGLEDWGRKQGATMVEAIGRLGWAPVAKAHGYTLASAVYRKEL
jgi:hypothetical protein